MFTKIIAHKGYSQLYPENTLLAFRKAKSTGADKIELDIHLSKDRKLIVHHDYFIEVENGKKSLVSSLDSRVIKQHKVEGEEIPFLEEVIQELGKDFEYEIELKGFGEDFINLVLQVIDNFELPSKVEFTSPHVPLLLKMKNIRKEVRIGLFSPEPKPWIDRALYNSIILNDVICANAQTAHCPIKYINRNLVRILRRQNIEIHAANCNNRKDLEKALDLKVEQLSTNNVELALGIRNHYEGKKPADL